MAPSPSWRRSPGRDIGEVHHKRGRSFENGTTNGEKDDDLELFSELNRIEREGFLLQSSDDFEDVFAMKMKCSPDVKLGITIPARGASSDLLNADGDKNDYDWLLTPPESPLFPSLDDEPTPANLVHSGRPRSRSVSISRSSVLEKSLRSSRGSASPQRASPSPRSVSSLANGRPSSAPHSSPNPNSRPSSSVRRPSPQPIRSSTPPPRSATPPPRRSNVVSGGARMSTGVRGTSPVRTGRGNSASPKVRTWQPDVLGFSLEAPPNLRTSLADRPASYVRGSSPASRNNKDTTSKLGRRSMSPSTSRSISSSCTHERDRLSSYSRGSPASSVEDDTDSLQSIPVRSSERSVPRRVISGFPNNRLSGLSRKPSKTNSPVSAPKRSFDSAMRQMDRRSPQNMFRPLLSSVPSSTLYSGKSSSSHLVMVSMNSSITTSSNASSDHATSGAPDTEGSDQYQDDAISECRREAYPGAQDDAFSVDKWEDAHEFPQNKNRDGLLSVENHKSDEYESHLCDTSEHSHWDVAIASTSTSTSVPVESMEIGGSSNVLLCSTCGCSFLATETTHSDVPICMECQLKEEISTIPDPFISIGLGQNSSDSLIRMSNEHGLQELKPPMAVAESLGTEELCTSSSSLLTGSNEENLEANQISSGEPRTVGDSPPAPVAQDTMELLPEQLARGQYSYVSGLSSILCQDGDLQNSTDGSRPKANLAEGTGISVLLLKRSSSGKEPLLQRRNIMASAISYEDSSYARASTTSLRSSIGYGSASTSSSVDLTLSRHAETFMQRQLSSTRSEMSSKPRSNESTNSGFSTHASQAFEVSTVAYRENLFAGGTKQILEDSTEQRPELLAASENANLHDAETFLSERVSPEDDNLSCSTSCREKDAETMEKSSYIGIAPPEGDSLASLAVNDLHVLDKAVPDSVGRVSGIEDQAVIPENSVEENPTPDNDPTKTVETGDDNSVALIFDIDADDHCYTPPTSRADVMLEDFPEPSVGLDEDEGIKDSVPNSRDSGSLHGIVEESTITVEDQGGRRTRNLTLEEVTDTILFCSSIVHDLAYKAATIAIEKEKENLSPLEGSRPTVTIPGGNRSSDPVNPRGRTPSKRSAKSQRQKQRQDKKENEPIPYHAPRGDEKPVEPMTRIVGLQNKVDNKIDDMKPPKMESKCNCTIM